jgi:hypothetical protein
MNISIVEIAEILYKHKMNLKKFTKAELISKIKDFNSQNTQNKQGIFTKI